MWFALLLFLATAPAFACSCTSYERRNACEVYPRHAVSFRGRVVDRFLEPGFGFRRLALYRFQVLEVFKGLPVGMRYVFVNPGSYTSCMTGFLENREYLVYAGALEIGAAAATISSVSAEIKGNIKFPAAWKGLERAHVLVVMGCNPTRPVEPDDPDIGYLRNAALMPDKTPGWIEGRTIQNSSYPSRAAEHVPVTDATVFAYSGPRQKRSVRVQSDGTFRLGNLPPGRYVLDFRSPSFGEGMLNDFRVDVPSGGCATAYPTFESRASISGRVLDWRGHPVKGLTLDLKHLENAQQPRWVPGRPSYTDERGYFKIDPVPAGRVIVGINLAGTATSREPFDPTYAPGTQDLRKARVLQVAPGEQVTGVSLRLPKPRPIAPLDVDVFWPDGSPAKDRVRATALWEDHLAASNTAAPASNRVRLHLVPGRRYQIGADWMKVKPDGFWIAWQPTPVPVTFTRGGQRVKVYLPPPRINE